MPQAAAAPTRTVRLTTSLLPLINAGHVSSIWHDILPIPPPPSSNGARSPVANSSSPRQPPAFPFPTSAFKFVCRASKTIFADRDRERRRRHTGNEDPLLESLQEKRKVVVLTLDGSLCNGYST
ncbi:unnamed protein product [Closterium sp. NIES-54]